MSYLTNTQLELLRERPHSTKLWLSIYQPSIALACQVNDAEIEVGEMTIVYDNVSEGAHGNVISGMTMLVGTSAGSADKGKIRVRSANATQIVVAENSHIQWEDNLYLTVLKFFEAWPVPTYYEQFDDVVVPYKDYNIAYSDQNEKFGSFINMGSHYAGFVGDEVYYTASGTINAGGDGISEYSWSFEGGTPDNSAVHTPGTVSYNTPGHYTTRLQVESGSGTVDSSYRHVSIYDRPENGTNNPILRWELDNLTGSRDEGGYSAKIIIHEDVDFLVDGALVVIFADDVYGNTEISIGGNAMGRQKIVFAGYIMDGSIVYDYQHSTVEFEVISITNVMKERGSTSIATDVDSVETPTSWFEIKDLDVLKALYHFLRWHSTVLNVADVVYKGDNYLFQYFVADPSSLYDAINNFVENSLIGSIVSDRQGTIFVEVNPGAIDDAENVLPLGMEIMKEDWMNEPEIEERVYHPISYLEMGGVAWSGVYTGTSDAFMSSAPGFSESFYGDGEERQGLILTTQEHLNEIVGNVYAYENARYPNVRFEIAGNYRNLDIAPLEKQLVTINSEDTKRGIVFAQKAFHITEMDWEYDPEKQFFNPISLELHEITQGYPGHTIDIPQTPIDNIPIIPPGVIDPPTFPIIPRPRYPGHPNPPWITPPVPPGDIPYNCMTDMSAAPNGPYRLSLYTCYTRSPLRAVRLLSRTCGGYGMRNCVQGSIYVDPRVFAQARARTSGHTHKTTILVDGCWEYSDDNCVTWQPWLDNDGWQIFVRSTDGHVSYPDMSIINPPNKACGVRGGYLTSGSPFSQVVIRLDSLDDDYEEVTDGWYKDGGGPSSYYRLDTWTPPGEYWSYGAGGALPEYPDNAWAVVIRRLVYKGAGNHWGLARGGNEIDGWRALVNWQGNLDIYKAYIRSGAPAGLSEAISTIYPTRESDVYETAPWWYGETNKYVQAGGSCGVEVQPGEEVDSYVYVVDVFYEGFIPAKRIKVERISVLNICVEDSWYDW